MKKLVNLEEIETGRVILLFSTSWCGDCIVLDNYIDDVVEKFQDSWSFFYVDRDLHMDIAKDFNIFGIPSFVALNDSIKISDFISKDSKSFNDICNWIENIEETDEYKG